jgi:hypothetical protein
MATVVPAAASAWYVAAASPRVNSVSAWPWTSRVGVVTREAYETTDACRASAVVSAVG